MPKLGLSKCMPLKSIKDDIWQNNRSSVCCGLNIARHNEYLFNDSKLGHFSLCRHGRMTMRLKNNNWGNVVIHHNVLPPRQRCQVYSIIQIEIRICFASRNYMIKWRVANGMELDDIAGDSCLSISVDYSTYQWRLAKQMEKWTSHLNLDRFSKVRQSNLLCNAWLHVTMA